MSENRLVEKICNQIDASPTPYHATARVIKDLSSKGFQKVDIESSFPSSPGSYYISQTSSLICWQQGSSIKPFKVVGAHSDSPNLRIRPNPNTSSEFGTQLLVEVYGSPLLNSWLDRDLGLAGIVCTRGKNGLSNHLLRIENPFLRIPQLAIHLDRGIKSSGLKLDPQTHIDPMWLGDTNFFDQGLNHIISEKLEIPPEDILSSDIMLFDLQGSKVSGSFEEGHLSSSRIDNLLSVFTATNCFSENQDAEVQSIPVLAVFDHEEVGSRSSLGADGSFFANVIERISAALGTSRDDHLWTLSESFLLSVDGAHATNPNYVSKHEPNHRIAMNNGIAIKHNVNQRYATTFETESAFLEMISDLNIKTQRYSHRNDIACGSTIGPSLSANTTIATVDIGVPQLAMHSIRETAGCADIIDMSKVIKTFWST